MWEITVKAQLLSFLCGVAVGAFLSLLFDFFRTLRKCIKHSAYTVFFEDILFFIIATFVTFMLLMARCNGEVRAYIIFALIMGFFLYRLTLSRLLFPFSTLVFKLFMRFFKKIGSIIRKSLSVIKKIIKNLKKRIIRRKKTLET